MGDGTAGGHDRRVPTRAAARQGGQTIGQVRECRPLLRPRLAGLVLSGSGSVGVASCLAINAMQANANDAANADQAAGNADTAAAGQNQPGQTGAQ
jgi:hypothetical protein